jgi:hypothetical protein
MSDFSIGVVLVFYLAWSHRDDPDTFNRILARVTFFVIKWALIYYAILYFFAERGVWLWPLNY